MKATPTDKTFRDALRRSF